MAILEGKPQSSRSVNTWGDILKRTIIVGYAYGYHIFAHFCIYHHLQSFCRHHRLYHHLWWISASFWQKTGKTAGIANGIIYICDIYCRRACFRFHVSTNRLSLISISILSVQHPLYNATHYSRQGNYACYYKRASAKGYGSVDKRSVLRNNSIIALLCRIKSLKHRPRVGFREYSILFLASSLA